MPTLDVFNPATGTLLASLPADDAASVARAFAAARAAQPAWAATPLAERIACVRRYGEAITAEREALARLLTEETGKPIAQARNELAGLIPRLDFFCEQVLAAIGTETVWQDAGMTERIEHRPLGVVANISAWNYPWFVGNNVIAPALLAGNAVLYKPSEYAPQTGQAMARLLHAAGVPAEVMVCLVGAGAVGQALLEQPVDGVFFTGSVATGKRIAAAMAGRLARLQLELGGKDPFYVTDDVDVVAAAESLADGAMYNTGQGCCSVERIYVHRAVAEPFLAHLQATVAAMAPADPLLDTTYIGAITRAPQLAFLESQVADALQKGARLLAGGHRAAGPFGGAGHWFEPTVLADVTHQMGVMRDESFGPIVGVMVVDSDEEAVRLMNDSPYGLTAGVYGRDRARAQRILDRVHTGTRYWNCCDRVSPRLPWSGVGDSGVGLTLSTYGIQAFTRPSAWHLRQPA